MKHSLFRKLSRMIAIILIVVVLIISLTISLLFTYRIYREKQDALASAAMMINQTMQDYIKEKIDKEQLGLYIDRIGYVTDARIYVIRYNEKSMEDMANQITDQSAADAGLMQDMGRILQGDTIFHSRQYSEKLDTDVVFAGMPLRNGTDVIGAIIMYAPLDRMTKDIVQVNLIIAGIALGSIFFGIISMFLWTTRTTKPIRDMQSAVAALASGENSEPIKISSNDEIGQLARAFNHMQEQLQRTEEVRKNLVANVSHELRTPLTSIQGFLQGLIDGLVKEEDIQEHLKVTMSEVQRLNKMTSEILELAKLQSGTLPLVKENANLCTLMNEVGLSLMSLFEEKEIELTIELNKPVWVYSDIDKMKQVMINLLGNAAKFTPKKGHVVLSCSMTGSIEQMEYKNMAVIRVSDNGIGMKQEELSKIFDKFHRVDSSGNPSYGGTGLGLHIVKTIVEMHKGRVIVQSTLGEGSVFEVLIPLI